MGIIITGIYLAFIIDVIRIAKTKKDVSMDISLSRTFLFGASTMRDIDEDDKPYGVFQVAFACLVLTITYTL
jgi:hypothetical protein